MRIYRTLTSQARLFPLWAIMATSSSERCCGQPNTGSRLARPNALLSEPLLGSRARSIEAGGMLPQCVRVADVSREEFEKAHRGALAGGPEERLYMALRLVQRHQAPIHADGPARSSCLSRHTMGNGAHRYFASLGRVQ